MRDGNNLYRWKEEDAGEVGGDRYGTRMMDAAYLMLQRLDGRKEMGEMRSSVIQIRRLICALEIFDYEYSMEGLSFESPT